MKCHNCIIIIHTGSLGPPLLKGPPFVCLHMHTSRSTAIGCIMPAFLFKCLNYWRLLILANNIKLMRWMPHYSVIRDGSYMLVNSENEYLKYTMHVVPRKHFFKILLKFLSKSLRITRKFRWNVIFLLLVTGGSWTKDYIHIITIMIRLKFTKTICLFLIGCYLNNCEHKISTFIVIYSLIIVITTSSTTIFFDFNVA